MHKFGFLARCLGFLFLGAVSLKLLLRAMGSGNYMAAFGWSLYGFAALITAVLLLSPEFVGFFVAPFSRALGGLIFPQDTSARPPVDYILAHHYLKQGRYEEACAEYQKITEHHPQEVAAYLEGILAASRWENPKLARRFYRRGLGRLRSPEAANQLRLAYRNPDQVEVDFSVRHEPV